MTPEDLAALVADWGPLALVSIESGCYSDYHVVGILAVPRDRLDDVERIAALIDGAWKPAPGTSWDGRSGQQIRELVGNRYRALWKGAGIDDPTKLWETVPLLEVMMTAAGIAPVWLETTSQDLRE